LELPGKNLKLKIPKFSPNPRHVDLIGHECGMALRLLKILIFSEVSPGCD
jgi:hypothetical protein